MDRASTSEAAGRMTGEDIFVRCMVGLVVLGSLFTGTMLVLMLGVWVVLVVPFAALCFVVGSFFVRRWDL